MAQNATSTAPSVMPSEKESEEPTQKKQEEVTDFFKKLLTAGTKPKQSGIGSRISDHSQSRINAENDLMRHTAKVMERKGKEE